MTSVSARVAALVVAAGLAADALSGRAALLVRPWFVPVLLATALLAGWAAARMRDRLSPGAAFLLLLPVVVGASITPGVASRAAQASGAASSISARLGDRANPLLAGAGGHVTLLQILLAEQQIGNVALSGRDVTVEAMADGAHTLRRSAIVCCAADGQSITVGEAGPKLPARGTWVRVRGTLTAQGNRLVLTATRVDRIPTPSDPFL